MGGASSWKSIGCIQYLSTWATRSNYGSEKPFHDNGVLGSSCTEHVLTGKLRSLPATLFCGTGSVASAAAYSHIMHCQKSQLCTAYCSCIAQALREQPDEVSSASSWQCPAAHMVRRPGLICSQEQHCLDNVQPTGLCCSLHHLCVPSSATYFFRNSATQVGCSAFVCCAHHAIHKTQGRTSEPHASTGRSKLLVTHWIQNLPFAYSNKQKAMMVAGKHNLHIYTYTLALAFTHNRLLAVAF